MKRLTLLGLMVASCLLVTGCRRNKLLIPDEPDYPPIGTEDDRIGGGPLSDRRMDVLNDANIVHDVVLEPVYFAYDSFQLADGEAAKVEAAADVMRRNPSYILVVEGHSDERGSREYNLSLGEHRALSVRAYLVGLTIDASRIQTRSYGEEKPIDPGHTPRAWRTNRRGEFVFYRQ